uniref:B3 domain-containing protein REM6-like n=1 Tax=Nicotiana sylvestris TaxID=4096 RepID=A0A1U7W872_NICSY|nr:PREDICTED: B3 domain-containing protein REM6-like [Nicotiana sylvestris]
MKKVSPKKPRFFKPILPGFKNGLKIPIGFLKYLKGQNNERAILRKGSKKWRVKVNGRRFEASWAEFAQNHGLQLGDMLIFRHEGNMEFEVTMFESRDNIWDSSDGCTTTSISEEKKGNHKTKHSKKTSTYMAYSSSQGIASIQQESRPKSSLGQNGVAGLYPGVNFAHKEPEKDHNPPRRSMDLTEAYLVSLAQVYDDQKVKMEEDLERRKKERNLKD